MAATGIKRRTSRRENFNMEPKENMTNKSMAKDVLVFQFPRKPEMRKFAE